MLRSRSIRALIILGLIGLGLGVSSTSTAAGPSPASLRLVSVVPKVVAVRFAGEKTLYLSPGIYVSPTGGTFEIDAYRGAGGRVALWQVQRDANGATKIRKISQPSRVRFATGLPQFFDMTMRNAKGKVVASQSMPFCPGSSFDEGRVDATGPDQPTYPTDCGGGMTKSTVWGIDQGWADAIDFGLRFAGADGTYRLKIAIAPTYVQQLGIPADAATVTVDVVVKTEQGGGCRPPWCTVVGTNLAARLSGTSGTSGTSGASAEGPRTNQLNTAPVGPDALAQADGVPDLQALPAHGVGVRHNKRTGHDYLDFGATIWNAGSGPLVVEGFRNGAAEVMQATQFIYQNGKPVSSKVIGQFEFDKRRGHHHWHMEDIAQYDLLDKNGSRVLLSGKQSFCLAPTDPIKLTLPGADWRPDEQSLWSACDGESAIWLREVLPAGWGDTYVQEVAGQSFDITHVPNGTYRIRVTADPNHHLEETSYDNNVGLLTITLGGKPGQRTVKVG